MECGERENQLGTKKASTVESIGRFGLNWKASGAFVFKSELANPVETPITHWNKKSLTLPPGPSGQPSEISRAESVRLGTPGLLGFRMKLCKLGRPDLRAPVGDRITHFLSRFLRRRRPPDAGAAARSGFRVAGNRSISRGPHSADRRRHRRILR